jgi:hypothetical protein
MEDNARRTAIASAYAHAMKRLRANHSEEFTALLREVYAERGIEIRSRKSKEEKLAEELEKARLLLVQNGLL